MKKIFGGIKRIPKNRIAMLVFLDVLTVIIASFLALYIRYDFSFRMIPTYYMEYVATYAVINIPLTLLIYLVFRLYQSVWAYASASELLEVGGGCNCFYGRADDWHAVDGYSNAEKLSCDLYDDADCGNIGDSFWLSFVAGH